jgi:hypothetical protein
MGKRSRKRSAKPAAPAQRPAREAPAANGGAKKPSRSEMKDAAARARLVPLTEGERPRAVTVAAILAVVLAIANAVPYFADVEIGSQEPQAGVLVFSAVLLVAAAGMWKARYWAVLGMQVLLGLMILVFSLLAVQAENAKSALIAVAIIVAAGVLFWHLVKAMARIQMPERRPS